MDEQAVKIHAARLIQRWIDRAGLRKEAAAARAGLTYHMLYRAYLDPSRPLSRNPERALALVRAFVERLTERERCRADEAIAFLDLTGTPIRRFAEAAALFPPAEWRSAFVAHLATQEHPHQSLRELPQAQAPPAPQRAIALDAGRATGLALHLRLELPAAEPTGAGPGIAVTIAPLAADALVPATGAAAAGDQPAAMHVGPVGITVVFTPESAETAQPEATVARQLTAGQAPQSAAPSLMHEGRQTGDTIGSEC
jgi:hypothetical protein